MVISLILGACTDVLKAAPVIGELRRRRPEWTTRVIYTGGGDGRELPAARFEELDIAPPDISLGVRRGEPLAETIGTMAALKSELETERPAAALVFGDGSAALAGALCASELGIPVGHVEAGLRNFDRRAPRERNRVLADAVSAWLFTTEREADLNLRAEGIEDCRIHFTGSTAADAVVKNRPAAARMRFAQALGLASPYVVVALSKPENVDHAPQRRSIAYALVTLADEFDVACILAPHVAERFRAFDLSEMLAGHQRLRLHETMGYVEFIGLLNESAAVLTDSACVQQEALVVGTSCVTLNHYTKHPVTLAHGGNRLAGHDPHLAVRYVREAIHTRSGYAPIPEAWDGHAAARIVDVIERDLAAGIEPVPRAGAAIPT